MSDLSPAFRSKADEIYVHLTTNIKPMSLNGQVFDGTLLTAYIDNLVNQLNNGALPNIENTFTYICRTKSH
jgi:hypothetical protein